MSDKTDNRICISKTMNDTKLEIWFSKEDEIRESVSLLERISQRMQIEQARFHAEKLWKSVTGKLLLDERITEMDNRIALSLLHSYPDSKQNADIMQECNLSEDVVYNILSGRSGTMNDWFVSVKKGFWGLSKFGEGKILELVNSYSRYM